MMNHNALVRCRMQQCILLIITWFNYDVNKYVRADNFTKITHHRVQGNSIHPMIILLNLHINHQILRTPIYNPCSHSLMIIDRSPKCFVAVSQCIYNHIRNLTGDSTVHITISSHLPPHNKIYTK